MDKHADDSPNERCIDKHRKVAFQALVEADIYHSGEYILRTTQNGSQWVSLGASFEELKSIHETLGEFLGTHGPDCKPTHEVRFPSGQVLHAYSEAEAEQIKALMPGGELDVLY